MSRLGGFGPREIRSLLRGKIDPDVGKVLVSLAERQEHLWQHMQTLAQGMDTTARALNVALNVAQAVSEGHKELKKRGILGVDVGSEKIMNDIAVDQAENK